MYHDGLTVETCASQKVMRPIRSLMTALQVSHPYFYGELRSGHLTQPPDRAELGPA